MIGKNSGIRSIGDSTHKPANATATFARRGTRGSHRSRRTVVTQAGSTAAKSFAAPAGRLRARTARNAQVATTSPTAISRIRSNDVFSLAVPYGQSVPSATDSPNETGEDVDADPAGVLAAGYVVVTWSGAAQATSSTASHGATATAVGVTPAKAMTSRWRCDWST
jgi:hypothetical protein